MHKLPPVPSPLRRAVLLQHDLPVSPGALGPALTAAGFTLEHRFREVQPGDVDAELVVVLGGFMGVYEADQHAYLREELALLETRLARGRPSLGICLGAQLLAAVAGSRVHADPHGMVIDVMPVRLTPEGRAHPAFAGEGPTLEVVHWHGDTFDPVPGATALAGSERQPHEAFALGSALGVLFHPEVEPATFEAWVRTFPESLQRADRRLEDVLAQDLPRLHAAMPHTHAFLARLAVHLEARSG